MNQLTISNDESPFDTIRKTRADGSEYWSARDLQSLMGYSEWRNFQVAIERAMKAAENAGDAVTSNFAESHKVTGARGPAQLDYHLSRYAAYLVAMNGDPNKPEVAAAQRYFAVQTRVAETAPAPKALSRLELIEIARESELGRIEAERTVAELEPSANAWIALASDEPGDMSVREAAQILDRDPAINTGQGRLFVKLREFEWIDKKGEPYQRYVDNGRLVRKLRAYTHPNNGEPRLDAQIRITVKGLRDLHRLLGGTRPLFLRYGPTAA